MSNHIFRCYDSKLKKYAEGPSNSDINWNTAIPFKYHEAHKSTVLQQCSGKQDRFGKWIFEGDIVRLSSAFDDFTTVDAEIFINDELRWRARDINQGRNTWGEEDLLDYYDKDGAVIIGNIFDGPMSVKEITELFREEDEQLQKEIDANENSDC